MSERICAVDDCADPVRKVIWCGKHYERNRRHGNPLGPRRVVADLPGEIWRPVAGYEDCYAVSSLGRVKSLPRTTYNGTRGGRLLKQTVGGGGYLHISLCRLGVIELGFIHRLVAAAFVGPRPEGQQVRHKDGDHLNNRADNLEYGTSSDNALDRVRHGTHRNTRKTHCPQSHEYTPENTLTRPGRNGRPWRRCLTCQAEQSAARYQRVKEARAA